MVFGHYVQIENFFRPSEHLTLGQELLLLINLLLQVLTRVTETQPTRQVEIIYITLDQVEIHLLQILRWMVLILKLFIIKKWEKLLQMVLLPKGQVEDWLL